MNNKKKARGMNFQEAKMKARKGNNNDQIQI